MKTGLLVSHLFLDFFPYWKMAKKTAFPLKDLLFFYIDFYGFFVLFLALPAEYLSGLINRFFPFFLDKLTFGETTAKSSLYMPRRPRFWKLKSEYFLQTKELETI